MSFHFVWTKEISSESDVGSCVDENVQDLQMFVCNLVKCICIIVTSWLFCGVRVCFFVEHPRLQSDDPAIP